MITREITFTCTEEFIDKSLDNRLNLEAAIGYLARWGIHSTKHTNVRLHGDSDCNLHATYTDERGNVTYEIMADQRSDGSYAKHS